MATSASSASPAVLPPVPAKHADFIPYVAGHPDKSIHELLEPYKQYDAKLREVFAQEPQHQALEDGYLNVVPVFRGREGDVRVRARDLEKEDAEEAKRYIMPLEDKDRRHSGSPAIVQSLKEFQQNFAVFCESSLVDLDWSNVVVAGSSVVTCMLPVPDGHRQSKRALRQYYHETVAPASDVDLFLYGLSEEDAKKKIIEIEQRIKDSILTETTTIRTKNAITIASQYPTRHIQIVLRIYKSVSEILTGFDVDCSCAAFDGKQVWAAPRALTAYMTQVNTIDLTRRSPSYESRLSKYSRRGFEVYWPLLERDRVDPTIFERNFARTVGLARLLVLERMPTKDEREAYMDERRRERGRPEINRFHRYGRYNNIKEKYEDEIAEWVSQEDVSDYHTFTIPYGPKYHAKKIEKLLYTKDLLLNAEWNKKDRDVNLHRHPAFFGYAEDVMHDCCGSCPKPVTPEEHDVAEEESKIYVSGELTFIKDDPGRQAIGSFNPITDADWTEMAYIGNTARLCQAIIDGDADHVEDWLSQEGADPNCRDYTGRTPLHLAVMSSSAEIVRLLIDHGARIVARLADGRTALHLAAARGKVEMVKMIMDRSEANEEEEIAKEEARKKARMDARENTRESSSSEADPQLKPATSDEDSDVEVIEKEENDSEDDDGAHSTTTGSFVKVKDIEPKAEEFVPEADDDGPDVYDVNVLSWDTKCSPLHYAILGGHIDVVKELVQNYGADVLLPIKLLHGNNSPRGAILTLVLALKLPLEQAKAMTKALLELGASCAQADMSQTTALHYISNLMPELVDTLIQHDEPAVKRAINHLACTGGSVYNSFTFSPLMSAISKGNASAALKLLEVGAATQIEYKDWLKTVQSQWENENQNPHYTSKEKFHRDVEQPIVSAVANELPEVAIRLLELGADPNTLTKHTQQNLHLSSEQIPLPKYLYVFIQCAIMIIVFFCRYANKFLHVDSYIKMNTVLDLVRDEIDTIKNHVEYDVEMPGTLCEKDKDYLVGFEPESYSWFVAKTRLDSALELDKRNWEKYEISKKEGNSPSGLQEKEAALESLRNRFVALEEHLIEKGAKPFSELYPDKAVKDVREMISHRRHFGGYFPSKPEPFTAPTIFAPGFGPAMTDEIREAYLKLFEAAWGGDLHTIKSLTLAPWGTSNNPPLEIATSDFQGFSPFHIAVLRDHHDVARVLVEISMAQYEPPEEDRPRTYRIGDADDESVSESSELAVYAELVDDKFTIDNIGEVATKVKSKCSPLSFMSSPFAVGKYAKYFLEGKKWTYGIDDQEIGKINERLCLQSWAITTNDRDLFAFLLDLDVEWTDRLAKKLDDSSGIPSFTESDFELAIQYGRVDFLAEMIKHGGAGMELSSLVQKSGVKYREKPKYYQGLSVHGKKRSDWIQAARGTYARVVTDSKPPLLRAAFMGSLQSVEWLMSDTPARHYLDFAEAYKDEKLIAHLNQNAGGFEKVLRKWLNTRRELVLHCAVMAPERPETLKLIKYLIQVTPESLETKSNDGHTPLSLAFSLQRLDAAKILIEAGADQTVRDVSGNNIIHLVLCNIKHIHTSNRIAADQEKNVLGLLKLIDTRLIPSLLTQRSSRDPGSLTPFASWLRSSHYRSTEFLRMVLEFAATTGNEHLELLDGTGDTPLHYIVKSKKLDWLKVILEFRPDLLYRENSVGITPYEAAKDACTAEWVSKMPDEISVFNSSFQGAHPLIKNRNAKEFAPDYIKPEVASAESIWSVCAESLEKHHGKRKLVSLLEANEVAKRLASRQRAARAGYRVMRAGSDAGSEIEGVPASVDEVSLWLGQAMGPLHDGMFHENYRNYHGGYFYVY